MSGGICSALTGRCEGAGPEPIDTPCGRGAVAYCNGAGDCVSCNRTEQCPVSGTTCTAIVCDSGCVQVNVSGSCDYFGRAGVCRDGICVEADRCDPYPCNVQGVCRSDRCDPSTGQCVYSDAPRGTACSVNGYSGECVGGVCDLCAPVTCNDNNQCTSDGTCNSVNGICEGGGNLPANTFCNQNGGKVCDGRGTCVECNEAPKCNDHNECTVDSCNLALNECRNAPVANGTLCGTSASICIDGTCRNDSLDRQTFSGDRSDVVSGGTVNGIATVWNGFYAYGLSGFYMNFTGSGVDHELDRMKVGFFPINFDPNIPGNETALCARYEDENADDAFNWTIDAQKLPYGSSRHAVAGCTDEGWDAGSLGTPPADKWPVLLGFEIDRATDYNVERIAAKIARDPDGELFYEAAFSDDGSYNYFCYNLQYAMIPKNRLKATDGYTQITTHKGSYTRPISATHPVLRSFEFRFSNGDHHVDQVGIRVLPGEVRVWFNDKNNDDPFTWRAWWNDLE